MARCAGHRPYWWAALLGGFTAVGEIIAGFFGSNPALLADGVHALTDASANTFAALAAWRGNGWRAFGARLNGAFLIGGALAVAREAAEAIEGGGAIPAKFSIAVAMLGLVVNAVQHRLVASDGNHDALRGAALDHIRGDLWGSAIVVAVGAFARGLAGWRWAPFLVPLAALCLAVWLAARGARWVAGRPARGYHH